MMRVGSLFAMGLFLFVAPHASADVKPAALFSDHMVLQQAKKVPVWGTAEPGEKVVVALGRQKQTTTTGADGRWMAHLRDLKPGKPVTMTIAGKNTIRIEDVLVGEVWLASGQSNMDFTVAKTEKKYFAGVQNEAAEIAAANYPQIRMFTVDLKLTDVPQTDVTGHWAVCSPETVRDFSAVGYFFSRDLQQDLHVPMGVITSTWGASTAQCWTGKDALAAEPSLKPLLDAYDQACKAYAPGAGQETYQAALKEWETTTEKAKAAGTRLPRKPGAPRDPHQDQHNPTLLYNGMIAPIKPYAIRGAIWYQGESNGPTAGLYFTLMKTLIANWRQVWEEGDFPFLFVQLANFNAPSTEPVVARSQIAKIREGQFQTLRLPNTGMVTAIDIGEANNIHPKNKQEVGRRLALTARSLVYHEQVAYSGPIYDSMTVEGNTVRLRFKHADGGLMARGEALTGFAIAGEDHKFVWADARIDGDRVLVSSTQVAKPIAVRYGWADNPPISLYNKANLPAVPFRTDE